MEQMRPTDKFWTFWAIGIAATIWFGLGVVAFLWQLGVGGFASLPSNHQEMVENRPFWATFGFALSVFSGVIGAVLLLYRSRAAVRAFLV